MNTIYVVGCGTLGSRVVHLLDGDVHLVDHDVVKQENLPVQKFSSSDIGKFKADCLPGTSHTLFLDYTNISLLEAAAVVVDCTDNLLSRRILSRYCTSNGIPLVHGAAAGSHGIVGVFVERPDLEDLYAGKFAVDSCRSADIDTSVADRIAAKQAELVQEVLAGVEETKVFLVRPERLEQIKLSSELITTRKELPKQFYITFCDQAGCMSAKPTKRFLVEAKSGTIDNVEYTLIRNGEIHFFNEEDADALERVATKIYDENGL